MLIEYGCTSPFLLPIAPCVTQAAVCAQGAAELPRVSAGVRVVIAGPRSFAAVLSVLSDELFWFCLQNEIGLVN